MNMIAILTMLSMSRSGYVVVEQESWWGGGVEAGAPDLPEHDNAMTLHP